MVQKLKFWNALESECSTDTVGLQVYLCKRFSVFFDMGDLRPKPNAGSASLLFRGVISEGFKVISSSRSVIWGVSYIIPHAFASQITCEFPSSAICGFCMP